MVIDWTDLEMYCVGEFFPPTKTREDYMAQLPKKEARELKGILRLPADLPLRPRWGMIQGAVDDRLLRLDAAVAHYRQRADKVFADLHEDLEKKTPLSKGRQDNYMEGIEALPFASNRNREQFERARELARKAGFKVKESYFDAKNPDHAKYLADPFGGLPGLRLDP